MKQIITAKLKLILTPDQKESVRKVTLAYQDALNYTSQVAYNSFFRFFPQLGQV